MRQLPQPHSFVGLFFCQEIMIGVLEFTGHINYNNIRIRTK
jgi:hypothetical protein